MSAKQWDKAKLVEGVKNWFAELADMDVSKSYLISTLPMIEY